MVKKFEETEDVAYIKFITKNWIGGEVEYHYYQGTWKTLKEDNVFKLLKSNIEEINDPGYDWYFDWD